MTAQIELAGLRVLVVEDDAMVALLEETMLEDLGCQVVGPAARLEEALALAGSAEFDCAILDVNLGQTPVFPVADLLAELGRPFAFATGYGAAGLNEAHKHALVLNKPFQEADLAAILRQLRAQIP